MIINEKHFAIASSVDNKFRIRVRQVQANYKSYTVVTVFWVSKHQNPDVWEFYGWVFYTLWESQSQSNSTSFMEINFPLEEKTFFNIFISRIFWIDFLNFHHCLCLFNVQVKLIHCQMYAATVYSNGNKLFATESYHWDCI